MRFSGWLRVVAMCGLFLSGAFATIPAIAVSINGGATYASSTAWTFGQTNAVPKVYVKVKNPASSTCVTASISEESAPPVANSIVINGAVSVYQQRYGGHTHAFSEGGGLVVTPC
jgi:hypothetical protein